MSIAKTCTGCHQELPLEAYHRASNGCFGGVQSQCKECRNALSRHKYANNKEVESLRKKGQYLRDKAAGKRKLWQQRGDARRRYDPTHKVHSNVSRAIRLTLVTGKGRRKWEDIVGYTTKELMSRLESKFYNRTSNGKPMTWKEYGLYGWHIDHIVPRKLFGPDQIKECWALSNLQPLWAEDNLRKLDKVDF